MPAPPRRALPKVSELESNHPPPASGGRAFGAAVLVGSCRCRRPDLDAAYAAALLTARPEARALDIGAARTIAGSIDAVIVSYYRLVFPGSSRQRKRCGATSWKLPRRARPQAGRAD